MSTKNQSEYIPNNGFSGLLENEELTYVEKLDNTMSILNKVPLSQLLSSEDSSLKNRNFHSSRIIIVHPFYQLVPSSIFTEGTEQTLMKQINEDLDSFSLKRFEWEKEAITGIYGLPTEAAQTLYRWNLNLKIDHIANCHYNLVSDSQIPGGSSGVFVHFCSKSIHLLSFNKGRLILSNLFQFNSEADILYYVLAAFKDADLNAQSDTLYLSGEIEQDGSIFKKLWEFVRNIDWVKPRSPLSLDDSISEPIHFLQIFN